MVLLLGANWRTGAMAPAVLPPPRLQGWLQRCRALASCRACGYEEGLMWAHSEDLLVATRLAWRHGSVGG